MGMPILSGALVDSLGYSLAQVGYIASAENTGMFLASGLTSVLINRVNRRKLAAWGILLAIIANIAALGFQDFANMIWLRLLSGTGAGIAYAVSVAVIAGTHHTARNFTFMIFGQVLTNSIILYTFPHLYNQWDINGILLAFCGCFVFGASMLSFLPATYSQTKSKSAPDSLPGASASIPAYIPLLCLAAIFSFYVMIASFWAYIERTGVHLGYHTEQLASWLSVGTLISLLACLLAYWFSERIGQSRPLLGALALLFICHAIFGLNMNNTTFFLSMFGVVALWNFVDIYQLGTISNIDHSGVYAARAPGLQGLAMALAPAAAGLMMDLGWGYRSIIALWALGALLAFTTYCLVYIKLKAIAPDIADSN